MGELDKYLLHRTSRESVRGHTHLVSENLETGEEEGEGMGACLVEREKEPHLSSPVFLKSRTRHQTLEEEGEHTVNCLSVGVPLWSQVGLKLTMLCTLDGWSITN